MSDEPVVMHIGMTGTRLGLSEHQYDWLIGTLCRLEATEQEIVLHHGDCIGADAEVHKVFMERGHQIEIHPPVDPTQRAFCEGVVTVHEPRPYKTRNTDIVRAADHVWAFVPGPERRFPRSGTWMTARIAKRLLVPLTIVRRTEAG